MNSANSAGSTLCPALDTFPKSFVDTLFVGLGSVPDFFDNKSVFFFYFLEGQWVIFYDNLPILPPVLVTGVDILFR